MLLTRTFEELGMTRKEDVSFHLKPHQIRSDNAALCKVISLLEDTINPFEESLDKSNLFNIATGKAASEDTAKFLLTVEEIGNEAKHIFDEKCQKLSTRFEKRIKRQKLQTFETENGKRRLKASDGKLMAACMVRDLFGSILCLSLEKKVDMAEILKYPLTPFPLALSHTDGTMQKTPKSALMKHLENKVESTAPDTIDVTIVDAALEITSDQRSNIGRNFAVIGRKYLLAIIMIGSFL